MPRLIDALMGDEEIATLLADDRHIAAILRFEVELAVAEAGLGMISAAGAEAVAEAVAGFNPDHNALFAGMAQDGVVIPALIRDLRARLPKEHASALHFGATSQDAIDSANMMQLVAVLDVLGPRVDALVAALEGLVATSGGQPLMAHTRMQRALPFTVAAKVESWRAPLVRVGAALARAGREAAVLQLGGPIGDGSSFGGRSEELIAALAPRLGLAPAAPWQAGRDRLMALAGEVAALSGVLGKIGADIALMAQNEVAEVKLSGAGTSSAMAHKANPVNAEVLVTLARLNAGLLGTLHQAMVHENERSGAAWTLEWRVLPEMLVTAGASTRLAARLLEQISFGGEAVAG